MASVGSFPNSQGVMFVSDAFNQSEFNHRRLTPQILLELRARTTSKQVYICLLSSSFSQAPVVPAENQKPIRNRFRREKKKVSFLLIRCLFFFLSFFFYRWSSEQHGRNGEEM